MSETNMVVMTAEPNTQGRHQFQVTDALELVDRMDRMVACTRMLK